VRCFLRDRLIRFFEPSPVRLKTVLRFRISNFIHAHLILCFLSYTKLDEKIRFIQTAKSFELTAFSPLFISFYFANWYYILFFQRSLIFDLGLSKLDQKSKIQGRRSNLLKYLKNTVFNLQCITAGGFKCSVTAFLTAAQSKFYRFAG
jgi:hypothetical protein